MPDDRHVSDVELLQLIDGELSNRHQRLVEDHLSACDRCRSRRQSFEQALDAEVAAYRETFAPPDQVEARARLQVALRETAIEMDRSWTVRLAGTLRWTAACGAAVAAALLLGARAPSSPSSAVSAVTLVQERPLPIASLTPGAIRTVRAPDLCLEHQPAEPTAVPIAVARQVLQNYGMDDAPIDTYELDYLITPELGGALDASNLWPQPYQKQTWNAFVKDELERLLPELVCSGRVSLEAAQHDIATDWISAYRKYFKTRDPLSNAFGLSRKLS